MITDRGVPERSARSSSSRRAPAKWRALKRPVLGSTRASSWSAGTLSERWIRSSGATAMGRSSGFQSQSPASATPSIASTKSVERLSVEKSPVPRRECPRAKWSIVASRKWFRETKTTAATRPDSANSRLGPKPAFRTSSTAPHAARPFSVWLAMLNAWMYQG